MPSNRGVRSLTSSICESDGDIGIEAEHVSLGAGDALCLTVGTDGKCFAMRFLGKHPALCLRIRDRAHLGTEQKTHQFLAVLVLASLGQTWFLWRSDGYDVRKLQRRCIQMWRWPFVKEEP
jgi:hypothetical protein